MKHDPGAKTRFRLQVLAIGLVAWLIGGFTSMIKERLAYVHPPPTINRLEK